MGVSIVVTSGKGGVGKTTTTANIGTALAMTGKKVVVIDADTGLRNLDLHLGLENRIVYNLVDAIEGTCRLKQALIKDKRFENLYLLPTAQTKDKSAVTPEQMLELVDSLKKDNDFIIIDCPAGIENGFENAIAGADRAIVVTTPEVSAVRDADRIIGKLEAKGLTDHELVINRIKYDMTQKGEMLDINDMTDILAIKLLGIVPDDDKIVISTNRGEPAVMDEDSKAGQAYKNIAKRILGEEVPLLNLEDHTGGFFHSIKKFFRGR